MPGCVGHLTMRRNWACRFPSLKQCTGNSLQALEKKYGFLMFLEVSCRFNIYIYVFNLDLRKKKISHPSLDRLIVAHQQNLRGSTAAVPAAVPAPRAARAAHAARRAAAGITPRCRRPRCDVGGPGGGHGPMAPAYPVLIKVLSNLVKIIKIIKMMSND